MKKRLLSFVLAVLMIASLLPATALAADIVASGTCGAKGSNLTWTLDSEGVLTISGTGKMSDYDVNNAVHSTPWSKVDVSAIRISDGVTSIGEGAFSFCTSLTSVTIPNSVTSIGHGAFYDCTSLTSVTIPDSVTSIGGSAFRGCSSLTSVTIPNSVTSIGSYAFSGCSSLTSVTIPDSVTSIGVGAFASCTSLTGIWVAEGNNDYSSDASGVLFNKDKTTLVQCPGAISGSYAIPDSVTLIDNGAFQGCTSLTSVTIPDSVTIIGDSAFSNCTSLTDVYYAGSEAQWKAISISSAGNDDLLTANIHYNYGSHTHSYKDVVTAPTCTEKGYTTHTCSCGDSYVDTYTDALGHAWDNGKVTKEPTETETGVKTFTCTRCGETKTEVIPATGVVASGTCGAEGDGSNLTWTLDSEGVLTISGSGAMHDYDYSSPWHESGNQIQSVFMANGVTSIGNFAFSECTSLTSMTIPDSVTCIGNCAFDSCTSLTSVTIPDSVTSIGVYAFCACTSLKSVTIPDGVTSIGDYAFSYCTSLTGIWVDEGNSHYFSDASGVLFNKDKTVLAQCPGAFSGSYAIPDGVTSINDAAFVNCESLTSVTIPDGVTNIGYEVFAGCTSLANMVLPNGVTRIGAEAFDWCTSMKSITIPDGVTSIGYDAFSNCKSLTNVYFTGTEEAWNGITIDGGNDALKNAKIHCNYVSHTHSYKDVVTAPTCTEKGYTTHTCSCGDSYVDTYVDALGHAWDNGKVTKEPTETETGVKTFTCTRCGETKTETIPKLTHEHNYNAVVTAPTCTEKGYTTHTCACGDSYVDTYTNALGHAWDNGKVTKQPTETETGVKTFTCTRCGETKTETIPKLAHEHSYQAVVTAPTCTEKGYTTHTCACGDSYVDTYMDALGHAWDNGKVTKEPTETETGVKTFTCTRCGGTRTETMPVIPHVHSYKDVVTAPTCTAKGYTTHTCACGDSYVDTYVDALGHAWDNGKVTKEPTEAEDGVKTFTCTRCGETKTETLPKLAHEHSYDAVVTAPTCTEKGYTTHTCACGDSYVDTYVDALGHAWDEGVVVKAATKDKTGTRKLTCTRCGEVKETIIPMQVVVADRFDDVSATSWSNPGIQYCVENGLMSGTGGDQFAPSIATTRAQIVQILYNLEGEPKVSGTTPFTDLTNDWYQDAVLWAYQTGVVAGTSATTFEPDRPVTREQIAVIIMEYVTRVLKLERTWTPADLSIFPDADSVSDWAKDAMADAVALGLISGASNGGQTLLEPQGSATREQVATILMEFCKNVKK